MQVLTADQSEIETEHWLVIPPTGTVTVPELVSIDGGPAPVRTVCQVSRTTAYLVVTFDCDDAAIEVNAEHGRHHPNLWQDDCVEVFIDLGHLHRRNHETVHLLVNAAGVVGADLGHDTGREPTGLETAVTTRAGGWQAVLRIPWALLGGVPETGAVWGFNLCRSDYPKPAYMCFSPTYKGFWQFHHWGHLTFAEGTELPAATVTAVAADHAAAVAALRAADNPLYYQRNLADLAVLPAGAGRLQAWFPDDTVQSLTRVDAAPDAVAVGVVWAVRHVVDGVTAQLTAAEATVSVEIRADQSWVPYAEGLTAVVQDSSLSLSFEPVACEGLRLRLPAGSLRGLDIHRYLAAASGVAWPEILTGPELGKRLLDAAPEPSFEQLRRHALSMPNWATTGLMDSPYEQGVRWDGQIHCQGHRLTLVVGESRRYLSSVRDTISRSLLDGWRPAVTVAAQLDDLRVVQTSFAALTDSAGTGQPVMHLRVALSNLGRQALAVPVALDIAPAPTDPYEGTLGVEVFLPPRDRRADDWSLTGGMLLNHDQPFLVTAQPCHTGKHRGEVAIDVSLAPGARKELDFIVPLSPWQPTIAEANALQHLSYAAAVDRFRAYWDGLLSPAMTVSLPEVRLNNLHRSVLTQVLIAADGDIMPYGAAPSNYDGAVFGGEEGYAMRLLAMSGLGDAARRYLTATYLRPELLRKAAVFVQVEDRNQQNKNGMVPSCAIDLYRLTRNRAWIREHLDLLTDCADWTIAQCRQTLQSATDDQPLLAGLLPGWAFSGDIHALGHPLFPNFACWRGLADTAWLLQDLGEEELARRYGDEAEQLHARLLQVVEAIYQRHQTPPFLPLDIQATEPSHGDFYQLFASLLLDLQPFVYSRPEANYLSNYLVADNRLICELPRYREGLGAGGIDGIYGLGHLLGRLRQNRIREFLLGFYAYQAFNLEHTCFSSRESTRIYASDLHLRTPHAHSEWSGPLACSSAVAALLLRHLLVTEETAGAGDFSGRLLLLYGAPRRWFEPGNELAVSNAITQVGTVSYRVDVGADGDRIKALVTMGDETSCNGIRLRLRHPAGRAIRAVTVNGQPTTRFDAAEEWIDLAAPRGTLQVVATY